MLRIAQHLLLSIVILLKFIKYKLIRRYYMEIKEIKSASPIRQPLSGFCTLKI